MTAKRCFSFCAIALFSFLFLFINSCKNKNQVCEINYLDPACSIDDRVNDLVSRMTLEEKASQLMYESPAIERLGIPEYNWWNECLHGVGRAGLATVFPQAIGMAAAFDFDLMHRTAVAISDEARAKHHDAILRGKRGIYQGLTFWTPNINIFRDPRWGRGMETYGEDPYLTGKLGVAFIKGLQGDHPQYLKLVATAKHFIVHSGPESDRHSFDTKVSDYDFYNTYLPHFKMAIDEANVQSFMCAYNRYDGKACCGDGYLLNNLLRDRLGFDGYVVSDCWALVDFYNGHFVSEGPVDAAALALKSGTDLNCGSVFPSLPEAFEKGLITEEDINIAVKRLFKARFMLGMFDPDEMNPYAQIPYSVVDSEKHKQLALELARKSMVLLKNENQLLPLGKDLKTIAVIGPNAIDEEVLLANYNGHPSKSITPLEGIIKKVGDNTNVLYARGCDVAPGLPFLTPVPGNVMFTDETLQQKGFKAEFFDTISFDVQPVASRIDETIDFNWWEGAPVNELPDDQFGVRWTGFIVPETSGDFYLGGDGMQGFTIYLNDELIVQHFSRDMNLKKYKKVNLKAGIPYKVKIEYVNTERTAIMRFIWAPPVTNLEKEAIAIAQKSDVVLMFMGLSPRLEGEEMPVSVEGFHGGDRQMLDLPASQVNLIKKIRKLNKPIVLVLLNGSAVSIPWEKENIPAILEAWYPGQAAGTAIADILFGDFNPSGRLPVTFYKSVNDLPPFDAYDMKGRTYRYFEGEPLFEFGYGLSYTTFHYTEIQSNSTEITFNKPAKVSVEVSNTGLVQGEEVVQLYIQYPKSNLTRPIKDLKGIERIDLHAGESKFVTFELDYKLLSYLTPEGEETEPGTYTILIGSSSADKNLKKMTIEVK